MRLAFASIAKGTFWLLEGYHSYMTRFPEVASLTFRKGRWHDRNLRCGDKRRCS